MLSPIPPYMLHHFSCWPLTYPLAPLLPTDSKDRGSLGEPMSAQMLRCLLVLIRVLSRVSGEMGAMQTTSMNGMWTEKQGKSEFVLDACRFVSVFRLFVPHLLG